MTRRVLFPQNPFRVAVALALGVVALIGLATALRITPGLALLGVLAITGTAWPYVLWLLWGIPQQPADPPK